MSKNNKGTLVSEESKKKITRFAIHAVITIIVLSVLNIVVHLREFEIQMTESNIISKVDGVDYCSTSIWESGDHMSVVVFVDDVVMESEYDRITNDVRNELKSYWIARLLPYSTMDISIMSIHGNEINSEVYKAYSGPRE